VTRSRAILKKLIFFCRPSIPVPFKEPVNYSVRYRNPGARYLIGCLPRWLARPFMNVHVSERIVELPFVFANLAVPKGSRVVDVGCAESRLSIELANLGFKVLAVDLRPYRFDHPNLNVLRGDFLGSPIDDESADAVIAVSTLEHLGLPCYGARAAPGSDRAAIQKMRRILKPNGQLILTVPYGVRMQTNWYRVYGRDDLLNLLDGFEVAKFEYYRRTGSAWWEETNEVEASAIASPTETNCVALVSAFVAKNHDDSRGQHIGASPIF
jgi:SAM-dependent methyltransferase